jgi:hypothetical protein
MSVCMQRRKRGAEDHPSSSLIIDVSHPLVRFLLGHITAHGWPGARPNSRPLTVNACIPSEDCHEPRPPRWARWSGVPATRAGDRRVSRGTASGTSCGVGFCPPKEVAPSSDAIKPALRVKTGLQRLGLAHLVGGGRTVPLLVGDAPCLALTRMRVSSWRRGTRAFITATACRGRKSPSPATAHAPA